MRYILLLLFHMDLAIERGQIHFTSHRLECISYESYHLHIEVALSLSRFGWERIERTLVALLETTSRAGLYIRQSLRLCWDNCSHLRNLCNHSHSARITEDQEHLGEEMRLLKTIFHPKGYHGREIAQILIGSGKVKSAKEEEMEGIKGVVIMYKNKTRDRANRIQMWIINDATIANAMWFISSSFLKSHKRLLFFPCLHFLLRETLEKSVVSYRKV